MTFLDCPAYLDDEGTVRCGLPAEVRRRFTMRSSDGPLEGAIIKCPVGHWFNGPIASLTLQGNLRSDQGNARAGSGPGRDGIADDQLSPNGAGGQVVQGGPKGPRLLVPRPHGAPPYYLGRPAWLWIAAVSPCPGRTALGEVVGASSARTCLPSRRPDRDQEPAPR
jgi:hypothetical protein